MGQQSMACAVKFRRRDDRAAAIGERQQRVIQRRLALGHAQRTDPAFQRRYALLQDVDGGISDPTVPKTGRLQVK